MSVAVKPAPPTSTTQPAASASVALAKAATVNAATTTVAATTPSTTTTPTGAASTPIPFRKTSVTSGPEVFGTLVITLLLLAALAALALFARRRGWLDRWITRMPALATGRGKLSVIEVLHVSRKTTLFRISDGTREFLLTESSAQVQVRQHDVEVAQA